MKSLVAAAGLLAGCLDAPPEAIARPICAEFSDWGEPTAVPEMSETYLASPTLSETGLLVWETMDDNLAAAALDEGSFVPLPDSFLQAVNGAEQERNPSLSADGLTLWFTRGILGAATLYVSRRAGPSDDFPPAELVSGLETFILEAPDVWDEANELFFSISDGTQFDLARAICETYNQCTFQGTVVDLEAELDDLYPTIRRDGLEIFYNETSDNSLVAAGRDTSFDEFEIIDPLDFSGYDLELTSDATTLYINRGNRLNRAVRSCTER